MHKLKISVAERSPGKSVVAFKKKKVRKGLFKKLFGSEPDKVTIIIPGDTVKDVTISEIKEKKEGGSKDE